MCRTQLAGEMTRLSPQQIDRYLTRIGLTGPLPPTAQTLSAIQWAHLHSVPFENLDICPMGIPISLDLQDVYEKIVSRNRGGFCFEQNSLYAAVLDGLGYQVARFGGHFLHDDGSANFFDHVTLHVTVPGDGSVWYADVAAGRQNPPRPVLVGGESRDGVNRVRRAPDAWMLDERSGGEQWTPVLTWDPAAREIAEFSDRCAWFQDDPESFFRQGALVTMLRPGGRVTLAKRTLISTINGERDEREIESNQEIAHLLESIFGIDLPVDDRWQ